MQRRTLWLRAGVILLLAVLASACTLTNRPEQNLEITEVPTSTIPPTRTPLGGNGSNLPTTLPTLTARAFATSIFPPTSVAQLPATARPFPTNTPFPISILILSPVPGSIVAGNVQVLGAASHPQFLQYQVEYGPDPNFGNLWFPITGVIQSPIVNGLLGIWNTTTTNDGLYQIRLRVTLRDGTSLATVVNNVRVQNRQPTPIPTATTVLRPIAAFTQSTTSGLVPLVVNFINQSQGEITGYSWNFGDGGTSTEINPSHTFRNPGIYTVTLTANGPGGASNVSRQISAQSPSAPVAGFTQDKVSGASPLTVQFTDQSTGNITGREWRFGDGATSTATSPSHVFTAVGTYNVILTVTGPGGSSIVQRQITVENPVIPKPNADFTASISSGEGPLAVTFTVTNTANINTYTWNFGGAGTSNQANPQFTFSDAGTYVVELIAVGAGGQDSHTVTITVTQPPDAPIIDISASQTSGEVPLSVNFTVNSSGGQISQYVWDFGDGATSTSANPTHSYATQGSFTVTLNVQGPGGTDSDTLTVNAVEPIAEPIAAFTYSVVDDDTGLTLQFTSQSEGEELNHAWEFGDGNTSSEQSPQHTYSAAGTYQVKLTVSNDGGATTTQQSITVEAPEPPPPALSAAFTTNPTSGTAPLTVIFDSSASTGNVSSFLWDFGDGSTSSEPNPTHEYLTASSYTATLTLSDIGGNISSAQQIIAVSAPAVVANPVITFSSDRDGNPQIFAMDADGANPQRLTDSGGTLDQPSWSTQSRIAFLLNGELYVMNADGSSVQAITENGSAILATSLSWSPDGGRLVFSSDRDGNPEIYTVNADGSGLQRLTDLGTTDNEPHWGNSGIVFGSDRDGNAEIYSMGGDGSNPVRLTTSDPFDGQPAWSPDGSRIAFVSERDGNREIYVMASDGSNLVRLTDSGATDEQPAWSSDGSQIVFVSERDGNREIYRINSDGGNLTRLTDSGSNDQHPAWKP
ncbi:MAG: PKD domain-containing protein [Phototrophicaceae bacterium]|jgi:PKD repeat protein